MSARSLPLLLMALVISSCTTRYYLPPPVETGVVHTAEEYHVSFNTSNAGTALNALVPIGTVDLEEEEITFYGTFQVYDHLRDPRDGGDRREQDEWNIGLGASVYAEQGARGLGFRVYPSGSVNAGIGFGSVESDFTRTDVNFFGPGPFLLHSDFTFSGIYVRPWVGLRFDIETGKDPSPLSFGYGLHIRACWPIFSRLETDDSLMVRNPALVEPGLSLRLTLLSLIELEALFGFGIAGGDWNYNYGNLGFRFVFNRR